MLRNLVVGRTIKEAMLLLKHSPFPEHAEQAPLCKLLFYKGMLFGALGRFTQANLMLAEALRKAPEMMNKKKGVNGFYRQARKQWLILQLILNEPLNPKLISSFKLPSRYIKLAGFVTYGDYKSFEMLMR